MLCITLSMDWGGTRSVSCGRGRGKRVMNLYLCNLLLVLSHNPVRLPGIYSKMGMKSMELPWRVFMRSVARQLMGLVWHLVGNRCCCCCYDSGDCAWLCIWLMLDATGEKTHFGSPFWKFSFWTSAHLALTASYVILPLNHMGLRVTPGRRSI